MSCRGMYIYSSVENSPSAAFGVNCRDAMREVRCGEFELKLTLCCMRHKVLHTQQVHPSSKFCLTRSLGLLILYNNILLTSAAERL